MSRKESDMLAIFRKFQKLPSWGRREQKDTKSQSLFQMKLNLNHSIASCSSTVRCWHYQGELQLTSRRRRVRGSANHSNESASISVANQNEEAA